jgi:hypothetical protein
MKEFETISFVNPNGDTDVYPVIRDYGLYRILGRPPDMRGSFHEPKVGTRLAPIPQTTHQGRELAIVPCRLCGDDVTFFFIDYPKEDRKRVHRAIIESNEKMAKPRGFKACAEEMMKEQETNGGYRVKWAIYNGKPNFLGLSETEKDRLGEARFNELNLIINEWECYSFDKEVSESDEADWWKTS